MTLQIRLFVIILLLGLIMSELKIIPDTKPISILGVLCGIGWGGLLHDYFKNRKKKKNKYKIRI